MLEISSRASLLALALCLATVTTNQTALAAEYRESDVQSALHGLASQDREQRASAAFKLTEMGSAAVSAIPALIDVLQTDESMQVRGEAAKALGNIGSAADVAVPALITFLQGSEGGYERTYAATALGDIAKEPEQAVPVLIEALQHDQEPVVRELAARSLGGFGLQAAEGIPALVEAIQIGNKDLREAAACGLEKIPGRMQDLDMLISLLGDEIDSARIAGAKSIGAMGSKAQTAIPALERLLKDDNSSVRDAAQQAIQQIKTN